MKYKLLRFSLMGILAMFAGLWGNGAWAAEKWVKTDASELQSGDVVVIVDQTTSTAMPNDNGTGAAPAVTAVTLSNDQSELSGAVADKLQWVVTKSDAGYQFGVAGTSNYLYCIDTNNGVRVGTNENNVFTWVADANNKNSTEPYLVNVATSRYIGVYNNQDWRCYTSINNNIKATVTAFYKLVNDVTDTREATTVTLGEYQTKGVVGGSMPLPSATVATAIGTPLNALVTWESSDESVASITDATINFIAAGTTTIKANFEGDNTYQPSHASFQLTVENSKVTVNSFRELQALCTSTTPTPATITFNGEQVVFVNGSNVFMADAQGYGALIFTGGHGLEVGQTLTGTIEASIQLYQGNAEITSFSKEGLTIGSADVVPVEKTVGEVTKANQSTLVTLKNATYNATSKSFFDSNNNSIAFYDKFKTNVTLEGGKNYDITGILGMYGEVLQIYPRTADDVVLLDEDNRIETYFNLAFESYEGTVGETKELGVATVYSMDDDSEVAGSDNWTVADQTIAIYNADTRSLSFLKAGATTVTVKYDGSEEYQPCEASFALTVKKAVNVEDGVFDFDMGYDYGSGIEKSNVKDQESTWTAGNVTMTLSGRNCWNDYKAGDANRGQIRLYASNETASAGTLTLSVPEGKVITNIAFTGATLDNMGTETGVYAEGTWTGSANSVTFTATARTDIYTITVGYEDATGEPAWADIFADFTNQSFFTEADANGATAGLKMNAAGGFTRVAADDATANAVISGKWHSNEHGISNFSATVKVEGPVKISFGTCAWGGNVTVKDETGAEVVPTFTTNTGACYHQNKQANIVSAYYKGEATTLTIAGGSYVPYFAVEAVNPADIPNDAKVTFDVANSDAEGVAPAEITAEIGSTITIPANRTLYKADCTLTAWTDGTNQYKPGDEVTINADLTLTPVFTENNIEDPQLGETVSAFWDFQQKNGAPVLAYQGTKCIYVTQMNFGGYIVDIKMDVDATSGKFNNASWSDWCQINNGTKITIPAQKGMVVSLESYNPTTTTTFAGSTDYTVKDKVATYTYEGSDKTIDIVIGDGSYFRWIEAVYPTVIEDDEFPITGTWTYADADVMAATMALSDSNEAGEVEAVEKNGLMMTVEANGASFRNNGSNIQVRSGAVFKIPVKNAGDLVTVNGYPGYSYYTIGASQEVLNDVNTYKAKISDAEAGYVAVTSMNDNNYYLSLSVVQYAPKEKITLDNEPATITFPFDEGTEGQKATFSNADYFLNSKVTVGSNWFIKDKNTYAGTTETRLEPIDQHNSNLTDDDAVSFLFTPKPGFTFTPTKVSFKANRFGTDNGLIDVYWQNADGSTVELEKEVKPDRNNTEQNTFKEYDITSATPGEGTCGLKLFLYHLQSTKQIGLADIVIEGILDGTEKDVPVLASFKINGNEYTVEDVFGEAFEATLELPKAERMVSANNPLTDVTATSGEVGEITYEEKDDACTVTIPMTAGDTRMDYVLNVVYKPDFTLEYIGVDGSVLTTQTVEKDAAIGEFAYDINEAPATKDGYKARGWFKTAVLGEKFTTADVITANTKLYAIQTEIEEASTHKKYIFDLADKFFYAEDHEAFNPAGEGYYWHDAQHGWAFKNGNTVDLLVGPKATITVTLCQYGSGTGIAVKKGEEVLETLPGIADGDGGTAVYTYEGEPGTLTLEMQCSGEMYIHGVKIVNTAEVNFESQGNWYFVKAGDAGSLIDVIEVVNGINASRDAARSFIFLPDGTYDLDATVKTAITGHNISIIGQSMDKTIIVTKPDISVEGLGKADMLDVSGTNLYMQDLTLKNALDYYAAGSAGRAAVIQDAGNRTIAKNVRLLSYQDTYYSSNSSQQAYWETCDIHGTVDFICGGGDVRFQNTTISLEPRQTSGKGGRTITAPTTTTAFGYVFDGCKVVDLANGQGDWNFGRTWQNEPICVYLNTTLDDNAKNTLVSSRWTQKGMNNKDPKLFGEYGTMDLNGNNITPASNKITSFGGTFETILTADQAASFAYDKMFTDWDPAQLATQLTAPTGKYAGSAVTWTPANDGAIAYALFKNGELVGITEGSMMNVDIDATKDKLTLRAANSMGGFGPAIEVEFVSDGISEIANGEQQDGKTVYNLNGLRVDKAQRGIYIINGKKVVVK